MKKLFSLFAICALFIGGVFAQTIDTTKAVTDTATEVVANSDVATVAETPDIDQTKILWKDLIEGFTVFFNMINWLYVCIYILTVWIFLSYATADNKAHWLTWARAIPNILWVIIIGFIWAMIMYWAFRYNTREELFGMLISMLFSTFLYKVGIDAILKAIAEKWMGIKFPEKV